MRISLFLFLILSIFLLSGCSTVNRLFGGNISNDNLAAVLGNQATIMENQAAINNNLKSLAENQLVMNQNMKIIVDNQVKSSENLQILQGNVISACRSSNGP